MRVAKTISVGNFMGSENEIVEAVKTEQRELVVGFCVRAESHARNF